jgi:transposase
MSGHRSFQLIEGEVSRLDASPATPRRRWSTSAKEEIVARSMMPGVNVSALARAYGIAPSQVFGWRRKASLDAQGRMQEPMFAAVAVAAEEEDRTDKADGVVELVVDEVTVRVGRDVSSARVTEIVRAIRAA